MRKFHRIIAAFIVISIFSSLAVTANATGEIMPYYNNTVSVRTTASVSSTGLLKVRHQLFGIEGVTIRTDITTYVEKKALGLFWTRVDIGKEDNAWYIHVGSHVYDGTRQCQLSSNGTYRITSVYVVKGTGGAADEITSVYELTY